MRKQTSLLLAVARTVLTGLFSVKIILSHSQHLQICKQQYLSSSTGMLYSSLPIKLNLFMKNVHLNCRHPILKVLLNKDFGQIGNACEHKSNTIEGRASSRPQSCESIPPQKPPPAWFGMTINSLLASIVRAVWDCNISSTFCVMPVQDASYFRTLFHGANRKLALCSC